MNNRKIRKASLEQVIEQFLKEKDDYGILTLEASARFRYYLVHGPHAFLDASYFLFLQRSGLKAPKMKHFCMNRIRKYVVFLFRYYGWVAVQDAVEALHEFWSWALEMGYTSEPWPSDFVPLKLKKEGSAFARK